MVAGKVRLTALFCRSTEAPGRETAPERAFLPEFSFSPLLRAGSNLFATPLTPRFYPNAYQAETGCPGSNAPAQMKPHLPSHGRERTGRAPPLFLPFFRPFLAIRPGFFAFLPHPAFSYYPTHSAPPSRPACPATTLPRPKLFCYDKSPARKKRKIRNRKPRFHAEKRAGAEIFAHKGGRSLGRPLFQANTKNVSRETKRREKRPLRAYSTRLSDRTKTKCFT